MPIDLVLGSNSVDFPVCSHTESRPDLETKCSVADILLEVSYLSDQLKCLHCLLLDIYSSSSLSKLVSMRWELARIRLLLRSLISIDASMGEFADSKGPGGLPHALSSQYLNHDRCCEQLDQDVKTPIFPWIDPPDSYYGVIFLPYWLNLRTGSKTSTLRANLGLHQPLKNLWDVTGKDIDRFLKPMLDSWLEVRASVSKNIDERDDTFTEEMKSLSISRTRGRRKGRSRKKASGSGEKHKDSDSRNHRPKLGAFIGQAREACIFPFLIGAAPVCYGVHTGITRKNKL